LAPSGDECNADEAQYCSDKRSREKAVKAVPFPEISTVDNPPFLSTITLEAPFFLSCALTCFLEIPPSLTNYFHHV
jgi:hypothetical protein